MSKCLMIQSLNALSFYKTPENASAAIEKLSPYAQILYWLMVSQSDEIQNHSEEVREEVREALSHNIIGMSKKINKSFFEDNLVKYSTLFFEWLKELEDNHFIKILGENSKEE